MHFLRPVYVRNQGSATLKKLHLAKKKQKTSSAALKQREFEEIKLIATNARENICKGFFQKQHIYSCSHIFTPAATSCSHKNIMAPAVMNWLLQLYMGYILASAATF